MWWKKVTTTTEPKEWKWKKLRRCECIQTCWRWKSYIDERHLNLSMPWCGFCTLLAMITILLYMRYWGINRYKGYYYCFSYLLLFRRIFIVCACVCVMNVQCAGKRTYRNQGSSMIYFDILWKLSSALYILFFSGTLIKTYPIFPFGNIIIVNGKIVVIRFVEINITMIKSCYLARFTESIKVSKEQL